MTVIIADHHPLTRRGVRDILEEASNNFKVIDEVSNGDFLMDTLKRSTPALLILELNMPGINGFQILRNIKRQYPSLKVVIFTAYPDEIYAMHCINSGASAYIHKTTPPKEFASIINRVMDNRVFINKKYFDESSSSTTIQKKTTLPRLGRLSARETEVLNLLLEGHRNKDIASQLSINEKTVSTYKSRLLKKLNLSNLAELINHSNALV